MQTQPKRRAAKSNTEIEDFDDMSDQQIADHLDYLQDQAEELLAKKGRLSAGDKKTFLKIFESFVSFGIVPTPVIELIAKLCGADQGPRRRSRCSAGLLDQWWLAVEMDAAAPLDPSLKHPSTASAYSIAKRLSNFRPSITTSMKKQIQDWRRKPQYIKDVEEKRLELRMKRDGISKHAAWTILKAERKRLSRAHNIEQIVAAAKISLKQMG